MAQYDGSIRINTQIDSKNASAQLMSLENRIVKTADKVASLRDKMNALGSTKIPTEAYSNIQKEITSTEQKLINLYNKQEKFLETGGKESSSTYKRMLYGIEELERKLKMAQADLQSLVDAGKDFTLGSSTDEYSRLGQQLQYAENELASLNQRHQELESKNTETESSYIRLGEAVRNSFKTIGKGLIDIPIVAVKKGAQSLVSVFSGLGNTVKSGLTSSFKRLGSIAKSVFSRITQHANKSGGALSSFAGRVKQIAMSFFIFNQIRKIFTSTVNAIKEGFTNLYNGNLKFQSSVDNLKASLLTLKNTLASAFAPIVETAIPYIQRLVDWLTKVADSVGQLIAAILGRKTYTKAIKQTTAALKEETKAQNKQLSSLDKLNNLTSQQDSGSDNGVGGMFEEEVPISDKWKNIADWLKSMWEKSDFYELGKLLGEKLKAVLDSIPWDKIQAIAGKLGKSIASFINGFVEVEGLALSIGKTLAEVLNTAFTFLNAFVHELHWDSVGKFIAETINGFFRNIDWDLIYDTLTTAAKGLSDLINNFTDTLDWEAISTSVSNFFNTLIDTIYIFVTETDWIALAEKLGKVISDAFIGIDWKKAGEAVGETFKAFFGFIATAIENVDWWAVGESVKDFLMGIDWAGVAESLFEAIGAALGGLAAFLGGLIGEGVENAKQYFQDKIEEAGGNVVEGILVGIAEALVGIGNWINEHIFTPFINGFKNAFGIHSPSTVMAEMGKYIIQGLLNGLKATWGSVTSWLQEKLQWILDKIKAISTAFNGISGAAKSALGGGLGGAFGSAASGKSVYATNPAFAALSNVEFPAYATGQVIPRTMKQHLAWLGDNNKETEIVSPLSTIEEAVINAMAKVNGGINGMGGGTLTVEIPVILNGNEIGRAVQQFNNEYFKQHGKYAFS